MIVIFVSHHLHWNVTWEFTSSLSISKKYSRNPTKLKLQGWLETATVWSLMSAVVTKFSEIIYLIWSLATDDIFSSKLISPQSIFVYRGNKEGWLSWHWSNIVFWIWKKWEVTNFERFRTRYASLYWQQIPSLFRLKMFHSEFEVIVFCMSSNAALSGEYYSSA